MNAVKANEERRLEYMMLWVRDNEMRAEGAISEAILIYHDEMNLSSDAIVQKIMSRFSLGEESAREYVASTLNPQTEGEA